VKITIYYSNLSKEIEFKKIEFKRCAPAFDDMPEELADGNRQYNRNILSEGVKGVKCIATGKVMFTIPDGYKFTMPDDCLNYYVSSGEVYENDSVNLYCRSNATKELLGYIILR